MPRFPEKKSSHQNAFVNRRVQRSAALALVILFCVLIGIFGRRSWSSRGDSPFDVSNPSQNPLKDASGKGKVGQTSTSTSKGVGPDADPGWQEAPEFDPKPQPKLPKTETKGKSLSYTVTLDPSRVALIIETRPVPALPAILSSFIATTPPAWIVKVVGSKQAFSIIHKAAALGPHIKTGKLVLSELPPKFPVSNNDDLSATLTNLEFYAEFLKPAEWILMFQTDSIICSASEETLDDWVDKGYSWVGAPWHPNRDGGNGGLSLRHVPSIVEVLKNETRAADDKDWEDLWLCSRLKNMAPAAEEVFFSVESIYVERPLGYHLRGSGKLVDGAIWQNGTRKRQILKYCPETKLLLGNMGLEPGEELQNELNDLEADRLKAIELAAKAKAEPKGSAAGPGAAGIGSPEKEGSSSWLSKWRDN